MQCKVENSGSPLPQFSTHLPRSSEAVHEHYCLSSFAIDPEGPYQQSQVVHHQIWAPLPRGGALFQGGNGLPSWGCGYEG